MGRPTTGLALGPGPSQWGDPVGLLPPQNKLYVGVSLHTARIILTQMPRETSFLLESHPLYPTRPPGWFTRAQTSTDRAGNYDQ
jgi:hypothetical protein